MNPAGAAKSQLNQFYQRCKVPIPKYDCKSSGQGFKCTITCPSIHTGEGSIELQIFTGKGTTKKASQAAAAAEAVNYLQDQPLFAAKKPYVESLWETISSSLSNQVWLQLIHLAQSMHDTDGCQSQRDKLTVCNTHPVTDLGAAQQVSGMYALAQRRMLKLVHL